MSKKPTSCPRPSAPTHGPIGAKVYFDRVRAKVKIDDPVAAYEHVMKWGETRTQWCEYIFEAYMNHTEEFIFLKGYPDDPASRPHSRVNW